jgi:putative two-component system response regulator
MTTLAAHQHILIVEHDELTAATYARMLRLEGYPVQTALSAAEGLREGERSRLDAIIVDFHMPGPDGLEFLRRLRMRDDTRHTPVAVVTGGFLDETIPNQLLELGAQVYFKPLWLDDLAYIVRGLLAPATGECDRASENHETGPTSCGPRQVWARLGPGFE